MKRFPSKEKLCVLRKHVSLTRMDMYARKGMAMKTAIDLTGLWEVQGPALAIGQVHLPGTLDENHRGSPDTPNLETRLTRRYTWEGEAVFTKSLTLPDEPGKRLILEIERARRLRLEIDGETVPALQPGTLSTPYWFDLTRWAGREIRISLHSDNSYTDWPREDILHASAATDETQTNWNGILGRFCIYHCPTFWIKGVRAYPHGEKVDVALDVAVGQGILEKVAAEGAAVRLEGPALKEPLYFDSAVWTVEPLSDTISTLWFRDAALNPQVSRWEEGHGILTELTATLLIGGKKVADGCARFGVRTFSVQQGRLALNGRKIFLRGEANCCVFPRTGHPPMEKSAWKDILERYRAYGVNCMRFHSWCPPEAAFEAADELGILLQPELSDWNFKNALETPHSLEYYETELRQILVCYANHPSFVMLTLGNELCTGDLGHSRMAQLVQLARKLDPTRLYAGSSNGQYGAQGYDGVSDFYTSAAYGKQMLRATSSPLIGHLNQCRPGTRHHYREAAARTGGVPVFGFEVGQYESWPDFAQIEKFDGVTLPENLNAIRRRAKETGADAYWQQGVQASGELALLCYREEVEAVLRTPEMSGLSLLGLQDFPGQGTALVGMMDVHLNRKPQAFSNPERFHNFFAPVVPLACFDTYTYEAGQCFRADLQLANYGRHTIVEPFHWRLLGGNTLLSQGEFSAESEWTAGNLWKVGTICQELPADDRAHALTLELSVAGFCNRYPLWSYPAAQAELPQQVLLLRTVTEEALQQVENGACALIDLPADKDHYPASLGCQFSTDFWSVGTFPEQEGTMGLLIQTEHPALAQYPTQFYSEWQWWTQSHGRAMQLPHSVTPIVRVLDSVTRLHHLGLLWEARLGKGRLLISGMDLLGHKDQPECRYLLECLVHYLSGSLTETNAEITRSDLQQWVRIENT